MEWPKWAHLKIHLTRLVRLRKNKQISKIAKGILKKFRNNKNEDRVNAFCLMFRLVWSALGDLRLFHYKCSVKTTIKQSC